jgi:hypothetical protein
VGQRIETRLPSAPIREQFIELLRAGNFTVTACAFTGISESAVYAWMKEATQPGARPMVVEFVEAIREARAYSEAANVQIVQRAAHAGDWRASAWFLEHSSPTRWGNHQRIDLEVTVKEQYRNTREQLEEALAQLGADMRRELDAVVDVEEIEVEKEPARVLPLRPEVI